MVFAGCGAMHFVVRYQRFFRKKFSSNVGNPVSQQRPRRYHIEFNINRRKS
jgi:hypothetical protein